MERQVAYATCRSMEHNIGKSASSQRRMRPAPGVCRARTATGSANLGQTGQRGVYLLLRIGVIA